MDAPPSGRRAAGFPVAAMLLAACGSVADEAPPAPASVLLITLDTTRADRIGCYGYEAASTPGIDALAAAGVRFDQAQSPTPLTVPSHATIMTGLSPRRHGVRDNALYPLATEVPVLAEALAAAGYDTAAAVSSFVLDRAAGLARGFEHYDDTVRVGERSAFNYEERAATQTNAAVEAILPRLEPPFLLWVHYFDPHLPYVPPAPFRERFAGRPYDGEIAFMDQALGELLRAVKRRSPRTLIVVAGDHGESLGDHGEASHGIFLYQSTQRVPLILAGPGLPRGKVVQRRVGLVDLAPTILDLLALPPLPETDGHSLAPLLRGEKSREAIAYEMETWFPRLAYDWAPLRALIGPELVLIDAPRPELYDLATDPGQRSNRWPDHEWAGPLMAELRERFSDDVPATVETDPDLAGRRMRLEALGYVSGGNTGEAPDPVDPKDGVRWLADLDRAREAVRRGRPREAIESATRLLERNPRNVPALLTLLSARLGAGEPVQAVAAGRRALEIRPVDDLVHFNLANALSAEASKRPGAAGEARRHYERALELNPRRADVYLNYASFLVRRDDTAGAMELLRRAEGAGIRDPDLAIERAVLELKAGDAETAIDFFERAVELNPYAADAVEALARLSLRLERDAEAARYLSRLLELAPDHPERAEIEQTLRRLSIPQDPP